MSTALEREDHGDVVQMKGVSLYAEATDFFQDPEPLLVLPRRFGLLITPPESIEAAAKIVKKHSFIGNSLTVLRGCGVKRPRGAAESRRQQQGKGERKKVARRA